MVFWVFVLGLCLKEWRIIRFVCVYYLWLRKVLGSEIRVVEV